MAGEILGNVAVIEGEFDGPLVAHTLDGQDFWVEVIWLLVYVVIP